MLNNSINYFNLIKNKMIKKTVDKSDLITLGVRDTNFNNDYKPVVITGEDFVNNITENVLDVIFIPPGATGATGATGLQGPAGPQGAVGPAGLTWQGAWVSGTSYVADDAVGYGGASYFCILATNGTTNPATDTTHWALLASQGAVGPQGPAGASAAGIRNIGTIVEGNPVTGGVANQHYASASILVPANSLATNSVIQTSWGVYRIGWNTVQTGIFINTVNSLVGATRIATGANGTNDGGWFRNERDFQKIGNKIFGFNFNQQIANDISFTNNTRDVVTIDPTVDLYIIFTILQTNPAETATINRVRMVEHT
jgi:hypothetical protein